MDKQVIIPRRSERIAGRANASENSGPVPTEMLCR